MTLALRVIELPGHKVVGALEMVGFHAAASVVRGMEGAVQRFLAKPMLCNEVAVSNPRLAAGEQLAYVPIHQAFGQLSIGGDTWEARYLHRFTGHVTTLTDPLDAYQLGSLGARKRLHLARFDLNFFIQIENLWNKTYRVVERRPMPGRYLQSGFSLRFP